MAISYLDWLLTYRRLSVCPAHSTSHSSALLRGRRSLLGVKHQQTECYHLCLHRAGSLLQSTIPRFSLLLLTQFSARLCSAVVAFCWCLRTLSSLDSALPRRTFKSSKAQLVAENWAVFCCSAVFFRGLPLMLASQLLAICGQSRCHKVGPSGCFQHAKRRFSISRYKNFSTRITVSATRDFLVDNRFVDLSLVVWLIPGSCSGVSGPSTLPLLVAHGQLLRSLSSE